MSKKGFTHYKLWDSPLNLARRVCFSKRGKTGMAILMGKTYFNKLSMQLTFSKQSRMVLRLAFFCSTMLPATRNEPQMLSLQGRCQKAHTRHGDTTKKGRKCETVFGDNNTLQDLYFPDNHPTMPGWFKLSSVNAGFGQRKD
jgi:hypothetical protein